jgi:hypothetical protein
MKKQIVLFCLLFSLSLMAQKSSDKISHKVEIRSKEKSFIGFEISFDNAREQDNCTNNIQIFNRTKEHYYVEFKLLLDGEEIYNGYADLNSYQHAYLNDTFYDCKSSYKKCEIQIFKIIKK